MENLEPIKLVPGSCCGVRWFTEKFEAGQFSTYLVSIGYAIELRRLHGAGAYGHWRVVHTAPSHRKTVGGLT